MTDDRKILAFDEVASQVTYLEDRRIYKDIPRVNSTSFDAEYTKQRLFVQVVTEIYCWLTGNNI